MRIAVTGGTGYVGGAVVRDLVAAGHEVTVLARRPEAAPWLAGRPEVTLRKADVAEASTLDFAGHDAVVHAAAWVAMGIPKGKRERFWRTNVEGTRHVVEACRKAGVRKLVHVSSVAALGDTRGEVATEDFEPGPWHRSFYETTKRAAHKVALEATDLDPVAVMPGVVVGRPRPWPDGRPAAPAGPMDGVLDRFLDGRLRRVARGDKPTPYVHVDDVAEATVAALARGRGPYLLVDGSYTTAEFFAALGARAGVPAPKAAVPVAALHAAFWLVEKWYHARGKVPPVSVEIANGLRADMRFDSARAKADLGWKPDLWGRLGRDYAPGAR